MKRKTTRGNTSTDLEIGMQFEKDLMERTFQRHSTATKAFTNLVYKKELSQNSDLVLENELKWVRDHIPDETWYFAGFLSETEGQLYRANPNVQKSEAEGGLAFFNVDGGVEVEKRRIDPLLMQDDAINTAKVPWEYSGIKHMVTTGRVKLRYNLDFNLENEHYEVSILKTNYRMRPSKSLEITPMFKFTVRNGFQMAEDRLEHLSLQGTIDGEEVSRNVRLNVIESADVRDMAAAFILKTVYQFTKTIKITGGGQVLLFNDMLEDANDFVRQAILAEMEKSFVAYEKELFLHIGAKYIDQRANADLNDDNYMETFVRVFGKF